MESQSMGRSPNVGFENATPFRIARKPVRGSGYQALVESATKAPPPVTRVEEVDYWSRGLGIESTVQREQSGLESLAIEGDQQEIEVPHENLVGNVEPWARTRLERGETGILHGTQEHVSAEDFHLFNSINPRNEASNPPRTQETSALPEPSAFSTDFDLSDLPSTFEEIFGHLIKWMMENRETLQQKAIQYFPPYKDLARVPDGTSEMQNMRRINENYTYTTSMEAGLNDLANGWFERARRHFGRALNIGSDREISPYMWGDEPAKEMMDGSTYAILLARTEALLFLAYASLKLRKIVETAVILDFAIYHCPSRATKEILVILRGLLFYGEDYIGQALPIKREPPNIPRVMRALPLAEDPPVGAMVEIKASARVNRLGHIPNKLAIQNHLLHFATSSRSDRSPTKQLSNIMLIQLGLVWSRSRGVFRPYSGRPWFYRLRDDTNAGIRIEEKHLLVRTYTYYGDYKILSKEVYLGLFEKHLSTLYESPAADWIHVGDFVPQKPRNQGVLRSKSRSRPSLIGRWLLPYEDEIESQTLPQGHRFLWSPPDDADLSFGQYTEVDPHKWGPMKELLIGGRGPVRKWSDVTMPETTVYDSLISYIHTGSPQKQEQVISRQYGQSRVWKESQVNPGDVIRILFRMGFAGTQWQHRVIARHPDPYNYAHSGHFDSRELAYLPFETIGNLAQFFEAEMRSDRAKRWEQRHELPVGTNIETDPLGAEDEMTIPLLPAMIKGNRGTPLFQCRCAREAPTWSEPQILDEKRHLENLRRDENGFYNDYLILCLGHAGVSSEQRRQRTSRGDRGPWDGCGRPRRTYIMEESWKQCRLELVKYLWSNHFHAAFELLHDGYEPDENADIVFLSTLSKPLPTLRTLLWLGADIAAVNKLGETALHLAILRWYDEEEAVEFLLENNAPREVRTSKGHTPMDYVQLRRGVFDRLKNHPRPRELRHTPELGIYSWSLDVMDKGRYHSRTDELERLLRTRFEPHIYAHEI